MATTARLKIYVLIAVFQISWVKKLSITQQESDWKTPITQFKASRIER